MDFFKDKIVFPEMLKLLLLSFAWLGNSGMCVLVGGGRAVNRKHHPAERCDLRFGSKRTEKFEITRGAAAVMFALKFLTFFNVILTFQNFHCSFGFILANKPEKEISPKAIFQTSTRK